jgi:hypothetical protein
MFRAAREAELTEIGFADHNPMPTHFDDWQMSLEEFPLYLQMAKSTRLRDFPVRIGCACDFI